MIGAPSPSDGNGAKPTSLDFAPAGGVEAGAGAGATVAAGGEGAGLRTSGPDRLPNTLTLRGLSRLTALELLDERGEQVSPA